MKTKKLTKSEREGLEAFLCKIDNEGFHYALTQYYPDDGPKDLMDKLEAAYDAVEAAENLTGKYREQLWGDE